MSSAGIASRPYACDGALASNSLRDDGVDRQDDLAVGGLRPSPGCAARSSARSFSASDLPTSTPWACRKVLAMPPPMTSVSTLVDQVAEQVELGRDLGAADDGDHRPLSALPSAFVQRLQLGLHGAAGIGRQQVAEAFGRGMRAVRGGEGVVDVDVAELGQLLRRRPGRSSPRLRGSGCSPAAARRRRFSAGDRLGRGLADAVVGEGDRLAETLRRAPRRPASATSSARAALRPAEMREQDDLAALVRRARGWSARRARCGSRR